MSGEEDWEKWDENDGPDTSKVQVDPLAQEDLQNIENKQKQKEEKLSKEQSAIQKSKQNDMNNVFDMFLDEDRMKDKKVTSTDFKVIGENLATKMNQSSISPMHTKEFLKALILSLDKKLTFKEWEELYQTIDAIYLDKKKKFEAEEAKQKKTTKGAPKGISWGKTKGQMDLNDDEVFNDDDDDFM